MTDQPLVPPAALVIQAPTDPTECDLLGSLTALLYAAEDLDDALAGHVAFGSAHALGLVIKHGLAFVGAARAARASERGGYRIALVREDGAVLVDGNAQDFVIDAEVGAVLEDGTSGGRMRC